MIEVKGLCKSFSDKEVLRDVTVTIDDGRIFGLVGINGAGKSTFLRLLSGIYKVDAGSILFDGEEIYENPKKKNEMFFLPDEPYYDINTTAKSLADFYKVMYDFNENVYYEFLEKFKLPIKKKIHNFSKGMKRQIFIALAFAIKPKYLFLDEAFDGLDPLARLEFKRYIINLVEDCNTTIIISSHSLRELEDICDCYGLLDNMVIASQGDIQTALEKVHKYQVAFDRVVEKSEFDISFISFSQDGRIIKVVCEYSLDEFTKKIKKYNPLIIDEIKIDFEELFIIEVESRGYLQWEIY